MARILQGMDNRFSAEALGYPTPTVSEVYMGGILMNALVEGGAQGAGGMLVMEREVAGLPEGYGFRATLAGRTALAAPGTAVGPHRLSVALTTPSGTVTVDVAAPSRIFLDDTTRPRTADELMPPHSTVRLDAAGEPGIGRIIGELGQVLPANTPRLRRAFSAARYLVGRTDSIDLPSGAHRLDTADMHGVMDLAVNFWNTPDHRELYPDQDAYVGAYPGGRVAPDDSPRPLLAHNHTLPVPGPWTPLAQRRVAQATTAPDGNMQYPSHTYGRPARPESHDGSRPHPLMGAARGLLRVALRWLDQR